MSRVEVVRRERNRLRFLAYNTFCEVILPGGDEGGVFDAVLSAAEAVRHLLDAYDPESEIAALRAPKAGQPLRVSDELFRLLEVLLSAGAASGGAFDITVGSLSHLWDFAAADPAVPSEEAIRKALSRVGAEHVSLDSARRTVTILKDGVRLDAGAAGKGYAAQVLAETLRRCGVSRASVNLGGNLYLLGPGPRGGRWSVGVQQPWDRRGLVIGELSLPGGVSVSTSGGYDRFFIRDGRVYHHLLDPRTGRPVENNVLGCTVICSDALMGDVLSTTLFVGGKKAMEKAAAAVCPDALKGWLLIYADGAVELSDSLAAQESNISFISS